MRKLDEMGVKTGIDNHFFDIKNAKSVRDLDNLESKVKKFDKSKVKVAFKEWLEDRKLDIESIWDINVSAIKSMRDLLNAQKKKLMKRESVIDKIDLYLQEAKGSEFTSSKEVAEYILKMEMAVKNKSKKKFKDRLENILVNLDPSFQDKDLYNLISALSLKDAKIIYNKLNGYSFDNEILDKL
jgi:hypothetical protein